MEKIKKNQIHTASRESTKSRSFSHLSTKTWVKIAPVKAFPENGGGCAKYKDLQIAIFNFTRWNKWYAVQNLCPHKSEMVLARGMIGDKDGTPKVACPLHKMTFSLENGQNLDGDLKALTTYPVKIENGFVYVAFSE